MDKPIDAALVWLRRDLRVHDHAALYHALRAAKRVWCAFVFDRAILDALPRADRRVEFIRDSLVQPKVGNKWVNTWTPLLLTLFVFILGANVIG